MNNYEFEVQQNEERYNNGLISESEYQENIVNIEHERENPHKSDTDCFEDDLNY